jgi:transcriptional regulator with XRE-family HTH domain
MNLPGLAAARKANGLTQEALAEKLCVDRVTVARWEVGMSSPDLGTLRRLSEVLGVSCAYILGEEAA